MGLVSARAVAADPPLRKSEEKIHEKSAGDTGIGGVSGDSAGPKRAFDSRPINMGAWRL